MAFLDPTQNCDSVKSPNGKEADPMKSRSVRTQLLLIVNLTLGSLLAILLVWDYRREMEDAVHDKQAALQDEAIAVHQAVTHLLQGHGVEDVQRYVDTVCSTMRDSRSPGHHIVVEFSDQTMHAHRAESQALTEALRTGLSPASSNHVSSNQTERCVGALRAGTESPNHRVLFRGKELIVARQSRDDVTVYISEYLTNIRRAIRSEVLWQLGILAGLALVAAAIVNVMLLKLVARPLRSLASVVSAIAQGKLGVQVAPLGSFELDELAIAVNFLSHALADSEQHRRTQMERARQIQEHLLPKDLSVPGLQAGVLFRPAEEVAGDYYDVIPLPDGTWLICVADVVGHGVPAAMGAAMFKMLLGNAAEHHIMPDELLSYVNRRFIAVSLPGYFVSVFLARWHPETMQLDYANAGHEPALLVSDEETVSLSATGLFVGIQEELSWTTQTHRVVSGDRLLMLTDGVVEAANANHDLFGRQRVTQMVADCRTETVTESLQHIQSALATHQEQTTATDDITVVFIKFGEMTAAMSESSCPRSLCQPA